MELVSGKKIKVKTKMCSVCLELFCSFCQDYVKFPEFIIFHSKFLTTLKEGRRLGLGKWAKYVVVLLKLYFKKRSYFEVSHTFYYCMKVY